MKACKVPLSSHANESLDTTMVSLLAYVVTIVAIALAIYYAV